MPDDLVLQLWQPRRGAWVDAMPFHRRALAQIQEAAAALAAAGRGVGWRVVHAHHPRQVLAVHDGSAWQVVDDPLEAAPASSGPMPWWQPAAGLSAAVMRPRAERAWLDTIPTNPATKGPA